MGQRREICRLLRVPKCQVLQLVFFCIMRNRYEGCRRAYERHDIGTKSALIHGMPRGFGP